MCPVRNEAKHKFIRMSIFMSMQTPIRMRRSSSALCTCVYTCLAPHQQIDPRVYTNVCKQVYAHVSKQARASSAGVVITNMP